jgi:hypothetical protein
MTCPSHACRLQFAESDESACWALTLGIDLDGSRVLAQKDVSRAFTRDVLRAFIA